jgi:hypothetical protein
MISDTHIPQARVVLDILDKRGPMGWYRLERLAPLHPDYVDARVSVREVLTVLRVGGYVNAEPPDQFETLSVTAVGVQEAERLRGSRTVSPVVVNIELDPSKFALLPRRRFAGRATIDGVATETPVGVTLLDELDSHGRGKGLADFLAPGGPSDLLRVGASLVWRAGDVVLGNAEIVLARIVDPVASGDESGIIDRLAHRSLPPRVTRPRSSCST